MGMIPWFAGLLALGVGYLFVGDSAWLGAFVGPAVAGSYVLIWPFEW